jgi:hypothetical protein
VDLVWNHDAMPGSRTVSSAAPDVSRVIAAAARQVLGPLGVRRKGRSRTWLDDHGWWLGIVEFQPSSWDVGSYLNVGLMFLWRPADYLVFEVGCRVDDFSPAGDAGGFGQAIEAKAGKAKEELISLRERFASLPDVTRHYEAAGKKLSMRDQAHLGIAWGLLGDMERCRNRLDQALVLRERERSGSWRASAWILDARRAAAGEDPFRVWVLSALNGTRSALKLPGPVALPGR